MILRPLLTCRCAISRRLSVMQLTLQPKTAGGQRIDGGLNPLPPAMSQGSDLRQQIPTLSYEIIGLPYELGELDLTPKRESIGGPTLRYRLAGCR